MAPMRNQLRQFAIMSWRFMYMSWVIISVSLVIFVLAESCYRLQRAAGGAVMSARSGAPGPANPQAASDWYRGFTKEYDATRPQRWRSYLYWGRLPSFHGRYINIDSLGHRVTPQPTAPASPYARVFFFGGSTLWGNDLRDEHTIPAEAARRLQTLAPQGTRIEVTNFGESGYVFTQELIQLLLELRKGNRPDVVVFYDGINDVGTTVQYGGAGVPQNESKRVAEFAMGRALDQSGFSHGVRKDLHALAVLGGAALDQLALVEKIKSLKPAAATPLVSADSAAHSTGKIYAENARIVEALSKAYGFVPIYVWQPSLHGTGKRLTPFEQRLMKTVRANSFQNRLRETQLAIPGVLDTAMASIAPGRFIDAAFLFNGDSLPVFLDGLGHNTEESVPAIVDAFWPQLQAAIALHHPRGSPR